MQPRVLVTDLDRTLTDTRLRIVPRALHALALARSQGIRTVLATGRTFAELQRKRGLLPLFDGLIAEGGALIGTPKALRASDPNAGEILRLGEWLRERQILFYQGVASLSISRNDLAQLRRYPNVARFQVTPNRNRADVTPRGIDKGTALALLRRRLGLTRGPLIAFGDGENDLPLLAAADIRIAVVNGVPRLKKMAHAVTRYPGGRGVADYLEHHVLATTGLGHRVIKAKSRMSRAWTTSSSSTTSPRSSARRTAASSRRSTGSA